MLGLTACNSDDLTSPAEVASGKAVHVTLTVDRSNVTSRTVVNENEDGLTLYSKWVEGDKLLVVTANQEVGELTLDSGAGMSEGVFSGELAVDEATEYTVWYLGGSNASDPDNVKGAYASWDKDQNNVVNPLVGAFAFEISGDIADLCRADLMKLDGVKFTVAGGKAYTTASVTLEAQNAMAHFKVTGYPASLEGAEMIATFGGQSYKVTNLAENVYLPLVPGTYAPVFTLTTSDNKTYKYTFANETEVEAGVYYKAQDGTTHEVTGIPVELTEEVAPEPPYNPATDPDLVGNVFEVNGKKFRFTKGNLKYNTETGAWSLMDHQYDFICKGGWTLSNGTWAKTKESEIDLYGYGATGLYDIESDQTANAPTFWKQTTLQTYTDAAFYYPTQITKWNEGYTGSYLVNGIKYTNFDWGKAYYLYKNSEAYPTAANPYTSYDWAINPSHKEGDPEPLRYFTLSSNDWENLQAKYFMCGVTITGITNPVNTVAKNNIYGCLIFPITGEGANSADANKDKLAKVKALLEGHNTYLSTSLTTNLNFTGTNYQYFNYSWLKITKEHFEKLEKLGVVFLPEAGHRAPDSYTKTDAYYWTSTNGQANTAIIFKFDGDSSPKVFKLDSQSSRTFGSAIRLVKEVPADYTDPMVVE